ncbi:hypothetical protein ANANG_G00177260 [Anguilla anguilla]|uniref:Uncharacterized protein n=1 Tax=Anguilla anguilla TaxID=7936 RepID=A0A9D3RTI6_ANGAN|nr:hypothetical protein ANANG_G00177260 [Anguilla anguilla]
MNGSKRRSNNNSIRSRPWSGSPEGEEKPERGRIGKREETSGAPCPKSCPCPSPHTPQGTHLAELVNHRTMWAALIGEALLLMRAPVPDTDRDPDNVRGNQARRREP